MIIDQLVNCQNRNDLNSLLDKEAFWLVVNSSQSDLGEVVTMEYRKVLVREIVYN